MNPDLARLRGRSPLVLVPIANPERAASLVDVAATLRTPGTGRVLLLSVVRPGPGTGPRSSSEPPDHKPRNSTRPGRRCGRP